MLAVIMPFFCMGLGLFLGSKLVSAKLYRAVDGLTNLSLILLMLTIGANVGVNETVVAKIGTVSRTGKNCRTAEKVQ